jgi:non-ribosomal peptide synthetase component F
VTNTLSAGATHGPRLSFPDKTLPELILDQATRTPDAVAVRQWDVRLSYRELVAEAAGVANALRERGVRPETRVGVCAGRRPSSVWATAEETRADMVALFRGAWLHSDQSIDQLGLDAPAHVSWWPKERRKTTFGSVLVRVVAETAQNAGHADILREMIDGRAGNDHGDVGDAAWWAEPGQLPARASRHAVRHSDHRSP